MSRTAPFVGLCLVGLLGTVNLAAGEEPIPPNCTLDPFTHTMNCPIPPNCTLDPFTHTMNCHVRSAGKTAVQSSIPSHSLPKQDP